MEIIVTSALSQLCLLVFLLMILTTIVGGKPESIASDFIGLLGTVVGGIFGLLKLIVEGLFGLGRARRGTSKGIPKY